MELYHQFRSSFKRWVFKGGRKTTIDRLINEDYEDIFSALIKSRTFRITFRNSLKNKDLPFSISFRVLQFFAKNFIKKAQDFLSGEISHIFRNGPLRQISFLSRPNAWRSGLFDEKTIDLFKNKQITEKYLLQVLKEKRIKKPTNRKDSTKKDDKGKFNKAQKISELENLETDNAKVRPLDDKPQKLEKELLKLAETYSTIKGLLVDD